MAKKQEDRKPDWMIEREMNKISSPKKLDLPICWNLWGMRPPVDESK